MNDYGRKDNKYVCDLFNSVGIECQIASDHMDKVEKIDIIFKMNGVTCYADVKRVTKNNTTSGNLVVNETVYKKVFKPDYHIKYSNHYFIFIVPDKDTGQHTDNLILIDTKSLYDSKCRNGYFVNDGQVFVGHGGKKYLLLKYNDCARSNEIKTLKFPNDFNDLISKSKSSPVLIDINDL